MSRQEKKGLPDLWGLQGPRQRLFSATGVALRRVVSPEGDMTLDALLMGLGLTRLKLPGAAKGSNRFGGTVEPLVWGEYRLRSSSQAYYLNEVDVKDDFWSLRHDPPRLMVALGWGRLMRKKLIRDFPFDELMTVFYWSLQALQQGAHPLWATIRFLWRWLDDWGIAPELTDRAGEWSVRDLVPGLAAEQVMAFLSASVYDGTRVESADGSRLKDRLEDWLMGA